MTERFLNVYSLYYKQSKLKFGASCIKVYYDIFGHKIRCQSIIRSDVIFSFIVSKWDLYIRKRSINLLK